MSKGIESCFGDEDVGYGDFGLHSSIPSSLGLQRALDSHSGFLVRFWWVTLSIYLLVGMGDVELGVLHGRARHGTAWDV